MLEINEPISVWALFKNGRILPHIFFWKGRKIKVEAINLTHTSRDGQRVVYYFSVSAFGNFYRLRFDPSSIKWSLEGVESD